MFCYKCYKCYKWQITWGWIGYHVKDLGVGGSNWVSIVLENNPSSIFVRILIKHGIYSEFGEDPRELQGRWNFGWHHRRIWTSLPLPAPQEPRRVYPKCQSHVAQGRPAILWVQNWQNVVLIAHTKMSYHQVSICTNSSILNRQAHSANVVIFFPRFSDIPRV